MFEKLKEHSSDNLGDGTEENLILKLEELWNIKLPKLFKQFLLEIGYAELYGEEIYSIYDVPDLIPCNGLHWMNQENLYLSKGFIKFFSNDIDGEFYINNVTGKVYLNSIDQEYSKDFIEFYEILLNS